MLKTILLLIVFGVTSTVTTSAFAQRRSGSVRVRSSTTKQGTYRPPHVRTRPNKTERDNWSTKGNTNPNTGKKGTRQPKR